jgi:protein-L-isoaspartate(D-aspartate) O-methyltransferase
MDGQRELFLEEKRERFLTVTLDRAGIRDPRVLAAMAQVPRELFVPGPLVAHAYDDSPLPIGLEQTISQPSLVALMTQILNVEAHHRVLEIGTGSGYQTAVLAKLCRQLYTVERLSALQRDAETRLARLNLSNVRYRTGDGAEGWRTGAPYQRILVTAAAKTLPPALLDQLAPGGRLLIPVGERRQELYLYEKGPVATSVRRLLPVSFVPLVTGAADRIAG